MAKKTAMKNKTIIINYKNIVEICSAFGLDLIMRETIDSMEKTFHSYNKEKYQVIKRLGYSYDKPSVGLIEFMPVYAADNGVTIKIVGYHPNNPANYNLETVQATINNYDVNTGCLSILCAGVLATSIRTGAASAVASKYLAMPNSRNIGLVGCGAQAVTNLHAISKIFPLEKCFIYDIDKETQESFAKRVSAFTNIEINQSSVDEIEAESDIICTATSSSVGAPAIIKGENIKPHVHINAIGSDFPGKIEVFLDLLKRSFICPDFLEQAIVEGECQQLDSKESIGPELHEVIKNPKKFEHYRNKITVFDSTGFALEDHVIMEIFKKYAKKLGKETEIELEGETIDPKNPYARYSIQKIVQ